MPLSFSLPYLKSSVLGLFLDALNSSSHNLYYFLGKVEPWEDDSDPPQVNSFSGNLDRSIRDAMVFLKKINPGDASIVVPRYNWRGGFVYPQWDDYNSLVDSNFYCITSDFCVFKCIDNAENSLSLIAPTKPSSIDDYGDIIKTSDGYTWKFMFEVPEFKRTKFLTNDFIPIQSYVTDVFYNNGKIRDVRIVNSGSGYQTLNSSNTLFISPTAIHGEVTSIDNLTGEILGFSVQSGIFDVFEYSSDMSIKVISDNGFGADLNILTTTNVISEDPEVTEEIIVDFQLVSGGSGYSIGDKIYLIKDTEFYLNFNDEGSIAFVTVIEGGQGFTENAIAILTNFEGTGTGKYQNNQEAILHPVIDAYEDSFTFGQVVHVQIEDPGIGYTNVPVVELIVTGDGQDAVLTPIIDNVGKIVAVKIDNPGIHYTYANIAIRNNGNPETVTAILEADIIQNDFTSDQSLIEQLSSDSSQVGGIFSVKVEHGGSFYSLPTTAIVSGNGQDAEIALTVDQSTKTISGVTIVNGGTGYDLETTSIQVFGQGTDGELSVIDVNDNGTILDVQIINSGSGYTSGPTLTVIGNGTGCVCHPLVNEVTREIERVIVDAHGSGYGHASIAVYDWGRVNPNAQDAIIRPVLPPSTPHGSNAVSELYAKQLMINSVVYDTNTLNTISQDFRQFGIIMDPLNIDTGEYINDDNLLVSFDVTLESDYENIKVDTILINNNTKYRVLYVDTTLGFVKLQQLSFVGKPLNPLTDNKFYDEFDPTIFYTILEVTNVPTIDKYSGRILYFDNIEPIVIDPNQILSIRTILNL